jgi:hypothetical protein
MEEQAKQAGRPTQEPASLATLRDLGLNVREAQELSTAKISFPRISQYEWPQEREDKVPGQHYHLTQIPFDVELDQETGLACIYQIFLHFEKPKTTYTGDAIITLAKERFQSMKIELGNILEPIAPFCSSRDDKAWNGMLKIHLKT